MIFENSTCLKYSNGGIIIPIDTQQGLVYNTPKIPKESEILYYDLPTKQQYWRTEYDTKNQLNIPDVRKFTEKERIEFISTWRNRWLNGMWFMNDGEPTYINGTMVDHLIFNKFNNRNLNYIECQRDDFYFREISWIMPDIDGTQWIKPRRYGATTEEITMAIYVLLSGYGYNVGIQSCTTKICKETILEPLIDTYLARVKWMREDFYRANGRPRSSLELRNNKVSEDEEDSWLGGKLFMYPTNAKAMEGKEHAYVVQDEFSKNESGSNPRQIMEVNRKTIRNAGRRGKFSALSTSGDSDDVIESTKEWIKLAGESELKLGQATTNSGILSRFVSAIHSQYLPNELLPNKYGKIDVGRNTEWVEREVGKKAKGTKEYYYEKRKLPLSKADALIGASGASYFDKARIVNRRKDIEGLLESEKPYVRGILEDLPNGKVAFKSDVERRADANSDDIEPGLWLVSILPYVSAEKNIDTRNRFTRVRGVCFPPINPEFVGGYDPVRYRIQDTKSNSLSRASIIIHKVHDYYGSGISDEKAALFLGRFDDPKEMHREGVKACKFWGMPLMHERNIESVREVFESSSMLPFLLKSEKDGIAGIYTDMSGKIVKNGVDMLVTRYRLPKTEDEKDQIELYPFEDGLIDLENFDIAFTTQFDVTMSEIMLEYGIRQVPYTNVTSKQVNEALKWKHELFPKRR